MAWICGHTHHCCHLNIFDTVVVSNQRGYKHEVCEDYKNDLVLRVNTEVLGLSSTSEGGGGEGVEIFRAIFGGASSREIIQKLVSIYSGGRELEPKGSVRFSR